MNKKEKIKQQRKNAAKLYGNRCKLCLKIFGKGFQFHHIGYRDNELKHSDFKSWYDYTMYIIPIIFGRPDGFALLCKTCHRLVTILQQIKDPDRFERVVSLARRSRK